MLELNANKLKNMPGQKFKINLIKIVSSKTLECYKGIEKDGEK